jgi:hypothetical protein
MATGKPPPRTVASLDKAALQSGIDKLGRSVKDLQEFEIAEITDSGDARLEHMQRKANSLLAELLGIGSTEYKKYSVDALEGTLDTTFGDRYSMDEYREAIRASIDLAVDKLNAARRMLSDQLSDRLTEAPAPKPPMTPAPTAAPTPAPVKSSPPPAIPPEPTRMNKPASAPSTSTPESGNRRVLILGGSGDTTVQVIDFLEQMGLEAAILDAPSVDRLDALRDAAFALVMPSEDTDAPATMLAIGFMLAALGRPRICLLAAQTQATSNALQGVLRIAPDDTGVWRLLLAREMKRAGLEVDLNRAI